MIAIEFPKKDRFREAEPADQFCELLAGGGFRLDEMIHWDIDAVRFVSPEREEGPDLFELAGKYDRNPKRVMSGPASDFVSFRLIRNSEQNSANVARALSANKRFVIEAK